MVRVSTAFAGLALAFGQDVMNFRGSTQDTARVRNGTLHLQYHSEVYRGNLLPQFLFMQGESDGLQQDMDLPHGGGRGEPLPFVPDDSCDDAIFEGASPDLRSPQLPYTKNDRWGCERTPQDFPVFMLEDSKLRATVTPQWGGKIWGMRDKVNDKEFFYNSNAHQPANIGATGAWVAGGLEFNWSPGLLGHSAFSEQRVWLARLQTKKGDVLRSYEFDRYNGTVYQVDMLIENGELWTHAKVTNPTDVDTLGYWWTCAAHRASPDTRVVSPANRVTIETYVGSGLRNGPWPQMSNGFLNVSFEPREVDSSYLGNIPYTGDYFLRIPEEHQRKWIAHVDASGYTAIHGHSQEGTKFFTWGQSGPGRFMQDFLAGGAERMGDYTELQTGVKPTQQQVFNLAAKSSMSFTEYFKPSQQDAAWGTPHDDAVKSIDQWLDSSQGVPEARVQEMSEFLKDLEDRTPRPEEIIAVGSPWGALEEKASGQKMAPGTLFMFPQDQSAIDDGSVIWRELVEMGTFSEETLERESAPVSYLVSPRWVQLLEESSRKHGATWLHNLLLGVAYAEAGEVSRPKELFAKVGANAVAARCIAVLSNEPDEVWEHLQQAWQYVPTKAGAGPLRANLLEEMVRLSLGQLGTATTSADIEHVQDGEKWLRRAAHAWSLSDQLEGEVVPDRLLQAQVLLLIRSGKYDEALAQISDNCYPTFGRARGALKELWNTAQKKKAEASKGAPLTPVEGHRLRKQYPVPRSVGCPYATQYCEEYW